MLTQKTLSCLYVCSAIVFTTVAASANELPELNTTLAQVLQLESEGQPVDRRTLITTQDEPSRWHRGIVTVNGKQVEFESLQATDAEKEYLAKRVATESSWSNFNLALWCKNKGLAQQYHAHLNAILLEQPNNSLVREMLGHTLDQGHWVTPEELQLAAEEATRVAASITRWTPRLTRLATQLTSQSTPVKLRALDELAKIDDVTAVYAMQAMIPTVNASVGGLLTNHIGKFQTQAACLALANIALHEKVAPNLAVDATHLLSRFHPDLYVPDLLGMLVEADESRSEIMTLPNGNLILNRLVVREVQGRKELHKFKKYVDLGQASDLEVTLRTQSGRLDVKQPASRGKFSTWHKKQWDFLLRNFSDEPFAGNYSSEIQADERALLESLKAQQQVLDSQLASAQVEISKTNAKVMRLLAATQQTFPGDRPSDWWNWWAEVNDRFLPRKPVTVFEQNASQANPAFEAGEISTRISPGRCLVAGTLIQSSRGLLPIEEIRIGDLLMSQSAQTGELALKPVFQIVSRPPSATLIIELDKEELQATPGHVWWVCGQGWLRTRELAPGMMLHTARGNIELKAIRSDPAAVKTYNLVVEGFHSYFVGEHRVLGYDNNPLEPTFRTVPGYGTRTLQQDDRSGDSVLLHRP